MSVGIFVSGFVTGLFVAVGALAALAMWLLKDTPRACAYPGCTTNHWNLEKFCSHHIQPQDEELHDNDGVGC